ncbi:MAG: ferrous iron transport protein B [Deltaproteobacteria bacterium]|nr:MAG: ferrous iron transport protein B [Deltaproteobacteria bacterium]
MTGSSSEIIVALAGQPNSGKSTIFNALTGARQHVANYPGITVEKKMGTYRFDGRKTVVVDLPGTYSLTSYTQEERVSRDFLIHEKPAAVVDVVDASNLERNLYLVFQLAEMGIPMVVGLNMMDVARQRGLRIDIEQLSLELDMPVVPTIGNKGVGIKELREAINQISKDGDSTSATKRADLRQRFLRLDYGAALEPVLGRLEKRLSEDVTLATRYPLRWLALKLMENDSEVQRLVREHATNKENILSSVAREREVFQAEHGEASEQAIAIRRYQVAGEIVEHCVKRGKEEHRTLTDRIDQVVCHRVAGPIFLGGVLFLLYYLTMKIGGEHIAPWAWKYWTMLRDVIAGILPAEGLIRSLLLSGIVDGVFAIMNYLPIFLILFLLIAILEDSGYMARVAFIMDRALRAFGLHGQSTLPMILGGVVVGGCAIPGVMATRAMKDQKARMTTIMIVPLMNCMAKVPLYVLLVSIFFKEHQAIMLWFMSLITLGVALIVASVLSRTVLKRQESEPFILEMPPYHLPTITGVIRRAVERTWLFVKKVITIIVAVAIVVWIFITFPGLSKERTAYYDAQAEEATNAFMKKLGKNNPYAKLLAGTGLKEFGQYWDRYKKKKMGARSKEEKDALNEKFSREHPEFFKIVNKGKGLDGKKDKYAKKVYTAYKRLDKTLKRLDTARRKETVHVSFAGRFGRFLEPVSQWAGFDWKINIALASSFAAKENLVATLGTIYSVGEESGDTLAVTMAKDTAQSWTPVHALALMLFVALFPPCIATLIMVRVETGSTKWMLFAATYPIILGFIIAVIVFQGGQLLGLTALQVMTLFSLFVFTILAATYFVGERAALKKQKTFQPLDHATT